MTDAIKSRIVKRGEKWIETASTRKRIRRDAVGFAGGAAATEGVIAACKVFWSIVKPIQDQLHLIPTEALSDHKTMAAWIATVVGGGGGIALAERVGRREVKALEDQLAQDIMELRIFEKGHINIGAGPVKHRFHLDDFFANVVGGGFTGAYSAHEMAELGKVRDFIQQFPSVPLQNMLCTLFAAIGMGLVYKMTNADQNVATEEARREKVADKAAAYHGQEGNPTSGDIRKTTNELLAEAHNRGR